IAYALRQAYLQTAAAPDRELATLDVALWLLVYSEPEMTIPPATSSSSMTIGTRVEAPGEKPSATLFSACRAASPCCCRRASGVIAVAAASCRSMRSATFRGIGAVAGAGRRRFVFGWCVVVRGVGFCRPSALVLAPLAQSFSRLASKDADGLARRQR